VLVDRVSRILLQGTPPDKILCLTYTKAAAAEMQSRLFETLGAWSILSEADLTKALGKLQDISRPHSNKELGRARRLFARALETPGGLKVQTIHGFCENILKRFPLEAGIAPSFDPIDERQSAVLQKLVIEVIETRAAHDTDIAQAIAVLAQQKNDQDLDAAYGWAIRNTYKIDAWEKAGGIENLSTSLGVPKDLTPDMVRAQAWQYAPKDALKQAMTGMYASGVNDQKKASFIESALNAKQPETAYSHYEKMFFTQKGEPNKTMVGLKSGSIARELFGDSQSGHQDEALRMIASREHIGRAFILETTRALYILSMAATTKYRELKAAMRVIDFDDQIQLTRRLLLDTHASEWVRYKLDGGVDHVLVDEAQDTSGAQWDIVGALSEPFFQPAPDADLKKPRTLFAVGDEKQSIYSFQGARPEQFLEKIQSLSSLQENTPQVKMSMSFRSSQEILNLVDEIFYGQDGIKEMFDATTYAPASDLDRHIAYRADTGLVEFWPATPTPDKGEDEIAWKPIPVDSPSAQSPREKLARQIAVQIKHWLDTSEPVVVRRKNQAPTKRPMRAGDILILVTKRTGFFDAVIRNLKEHHFPVAGADRLSLIDSIAVQDLLSLAKFVLLPHDDLSLAEVLKSPLFGWSEDELFELAHGRDGTTLWSSLPAGETRDTLRQIMSLAKQHAPYEFFARTLALVPKDGGESLLGRIYARLGLEAQDAVEAFLAQSLAHQRRGSPSLTRFVTDIERGDNIIKREMDDHDNEVRVMTVHGAKGLESPVVILPDTTQINKGGKEAVLAMVGEQGEAGFIAVPPSGNRPEFLKPYQEHKQALIQQEAMRLLYVALTRAETRLLICGFESNKRVADGSWHQRIEQAMTALGAQEYECSFGTGLRYGKVAHESDLSLSGQDDDQADAKIAPLPDWARTLSPAKGQAPNVRTLSPSHLRGVGEKSPAKNTAVRSPLWMGQALPSRYARGLHIHKLLQTLPELERGHRRTAGQTYLQAQTELTQTEAEQIESEVFAVLEHPDFAPFFAKSKDGISAAEISLAGGAKALPQNIRFSGQIDRLCLVDDQIWILDYKSNRPPPSREGDVALQYIRQMAAYRVLVREIFPGMTVRCALLWTDGPFLMPLSDTILDRVSWDEIYPS
ncbi:MAG: double-strand break repair helicase AddA, partial [Robiginitomaculum sp.]|nr:double-strand break repair helicase AddA [Robiginitomaculum sp.]